MKILFRVDAYFSMENDLDCDFLGWKIPFLDFDRSLFPRLPRSMVLLRKLEVSKIFFLMEKLPKDSEKENDLSLSDSIPCFETFVSFRI